MTPSDQELFQSYIDGSEEAFRILYRKHGRRVYGYIIKKGVQPDVAGELLQEIFLKVHRYRHNYNPKFPFTAWLFTIVRRSIVDLYRSRDKKQLSSLEDTAEISDSTPSRIEVDLSNLSQDEKSLIQSRFFEGKSYKELEAELGLRGPTLRKRVERILTKLRSQLGAEYDL